MPPLDGLLRQVFAEERNRFFEQAIAEAVTLGSHIQGLFNRTNEAAHFIPIRLHILAPIPEDGVDAGLEQFFQEIVERPSVEEAEQQGAQFLQDSILKNATIKKKKAFAEGFPVNIFQHVLIHSVFIYTLGGKKNEEIPNFFKGETKNKIEKLRTLFLYALGERTRAEIEGLDFAKEEMADIMWLRQSTAQKGRVKMLMERLCYHFDHFEEEDDFLKKAGKSKVFHRVLSLCEKVAFSELQQGMLITGSACRVMR